MTTTAIKLEDLRKEASSLKIKNYGRYSKIELLALVEAEKSKKLYLPAIIYKFEFSVKKSKRETLSLPRGEQSLKIYNLIKAHEGSKSWTLYKIAQVLNCTYTNVWRVYKKYVETAKQQNR